MARINGKGGSMILAVNSQTTAVLGLTDWELDITAAADEGTAMDSAGHQEFTVGIDGWKGSASGFWVAGTGNGATLKYTAGQTGAASFLLSATSGQLYSCNGTTGSVIITSMKVSTSVSGNIKYSIDFQGSGVLTPPTA